MNYKKTFKLFSIFFIVLLIIYVIMIFYENQLMVDYHQKNSTLITNQHNIKIQNKKAKIEGIEKELDLIEKNINKKINIRLFNNDVKKKYMDIKSNIKSCKKFNLAILKNSFLYKDKYFINMFSPASLEKIIQKEYNYYEQEIQALEDQKEQIKKKYRELPNNLYKIQIDQIKFDQMYNYITSDNENNLPIIKDFTDEEKKIIIDNRIIHKGCLKAIEDHYVKEIFKHQKEIDKLNNQILKLNLETNLLKNDSTTDKFLKENEEYLKSPHEEKKINLNLFIPTKKIQNLAIKINSLNEKLKETEQQKEILIKENASFITYFKRLQESALLYRYEIIPQKEKIENFNI